MPELAGVSLLVVFEQRKDSERQSSVVGRRNRPKRRVRLLSQKSPTQLSLSPNPPPNNDFSTLSQRRNPRSDWNCRPKVSLPRCSPIRLPCPGSSLTHRPPPTPGSSSSSPPTPTSRSTLSAPLPALLDRRTRTPCGGSRLRPSRNRSQRSSFASASRASLKAATSSSLGWTVM